MHINEDERNQTQPPDPEHIPGDEEFVVNHQPDPTLEDQPPEPPIWAKLENILSGCLAFIILIALPFIFWYVILPLFEVDPAPNQKTREEIRQEALEANWERFQDRAKTTGIQIQSENFELSLCPFIAYDDWREEEDPEEVGFICGFVTVPLDHLQPTGETIQIPIAIWPSYEEGTDPDPLLITHGGPGGSALDMYPDYLYPDRIGGNRDLVFVDQRGTHYARPNLICPEVTEEIYGALNPGQDDGEYDFQEELSYCRARLAGKGTNFSAFTTPQIARDFEVVWRTLGYDQINFYGISYGSHVGQYLAAYYPDNIRSLILDGVAPIPLDYLNSSISTKTRIFSEIISNCDQDPHCAENYPDLSKRLSKLLYSLNSDPVQVSLGIDYWFYPLELDGEFFYNFLFHMTYMDHNYAVLPYIIKEAEENRFDYFKAWVDWRMSEISENSLAYYAVICSEHQPLLHIEQYISDLIIPVITWENSSLDDMEKTCQTLGIQDTQDKLEVLPESALPTLLLSGNFDPITPPVYGEIALKSFSNGQHLIDPIGAHGVAFNDDCLDSIVNQFLENPLEHIEQSCLDDPDRRNKAVPSSAITSLFMLGKKDIPEYLMVYPVLMVLLFVLRYGYKGIQWIWKKIKKINHPLSEQNKQLRRRFELSNWVFALCSFGLGFGLDEFDANLRPTIYRAALALPEEARFLMLIPLLLLMMTPLLAYFTFRVWRSNSAVLKRLYLLLNYALVLTMMGTIVFNDMLWAWVR